MLKVQRQYVRDLLITTRRPNPVRDMLYDADTGRLSWTGPTRGAIYTHFLIRIDDDSAKPIYVVPKGTSETYIPFPCTVIITVWNELSRTESAPAYLVCDPSLGVLARRAAYPWAPKGSQPDTADPMFDETDWGFTVAQLTKPASDGSGIVELLIGGRWIVNKFSTVVAPTIGKYGTYATSGGTIPGEETYYLSLCSVDSAGLLSEPSKFAVVAISALTDLNTITIDISQWPSGAVGYKLFAGDSQSRLTWQAEASATPATITITAYQICNAGIPDKEFRRYRVQEKRILHSGCFGQEVDDVAAGTITIDDAGWTVNQWASHKLSVIGKGADGFVGIWDFVVSSNTADTLTMTPDPVAIGIFPGDVLVMRSRSTVGVDGGGNYLSDANWVNSLDNQGLGLLASGEVGRIIRFISGPGRGREYRIKSNTTTKIYIDGDWVTGETPTIDSVFVIAEPVWQTIKHTEDLANSEFTANITLQTLIANEDRLPRLVQVLTINQDGIESIDYLSPVREIYIFGEPGDGAYEPCGFNLGVCAVLAVNDTTDNKGLVETDGHMLIWGIHAETQSTSGDIVVDVLVSRDGFVTENSIFYDGNSNKLVLSFGGARHTQVKSFHPTYGAVLAGDLLRPKVISAGTGVRFVSVKGIWRKRGYRSAILDFSFEGGVVGMVTLVG